MVLISSKKIRTWVFTFHRIVGLGIGLVIAVVGLTGSLLVFSPELSNTQIKSQLPVIQPEDERLPLPVLYQRAEAYAQANVPQFHEITELAESEHRFFQADEPIYFGYSDMADQFHLLYLNPYTAEVIGNETNTDDIDAFWASLLAFHEGLFAGQWGLYFVGAVGLLTTLLCLSGTILWPGWRKLIAGFKIKWQGHIKRRNFDVHKVVGILASLFLAMATFTGFCWNYSSWTMPAIYALTFSQPGPTDQGVDVPVYSRPIPNVITVGLLGQHLPKMVKMAEATLPGSRFSNAYIGSEPTGIIDWVQCYDTYDCGVLEFDKYSGDLIRTWGLYTGRSRGDFIINTFPAIHYGFFGGLPTRILYVCMGLSPSILIMTGWIMWRHRRKMPDLSTDAVSRPKLPDLRSH